VNLLDAYAVVAFLLEEPAAGEVEELLRNEECGITVVNLAETVDVCLRVRRLGSAELRGAIEPLLGSEIEVVQHSEEDAWKAAEMRVQHHERRDTALSLADCFLVVAARPGDRIATADPALARVARSENVDVVALPDRAGNRP
jgi:PIN domain nuclease of toxin-antitoxin system